MKTRRFLLAAAVMMAAAACSGDITTPNPAFQADEAAALESESTTATPTPEVPADDGGHIGSGVGR